MLKIKDKLGKLLAILKDQDTKPEIQQKCCQNCECCCSEEGCKKSEKTCNKECK